jgi:hypothetical protein
MINDVSDVSCVQCKNSVCSECHVKVSKCPFCRHSGFGDTRRVISRRARLTETQINDILYVGIIIRDRRIRGGSNEYFTYLRNTLGFENFELIAHQILMAPRIEVPPNGPLLVEEADRNIRAIRAIRADQLRRRNAAASASAAVQADQLRRNAARAAVTTSSERSFTVKLTTKSVIVTFGGSKRFIFKRNATTTRTYLGTRYMYDHVQGGIVILLD